MRAQRVGPPFIAVLHCLGPRGTLCGSNNFLTSSWQMQTIPPNGMGCVLVSCTAAFSFPCLRHVLSHMKAALSAGMRRPRISGTGTCRRRRKTQLKCWWHPMRRGDVRLAHSRGLACGTVVGKGAPLPCFSSALAPGLPWERARHILSSCSPHLSLMVARCHLLSFCKRAEVCLAPCRRE